MEPVVATSNAQRTLSAPDQPEAITATTDSSEQISEPFIATIIRLDQSDAERVFLAARL